MGALTAHAGGEPGERRKAEGVGPSNPSVAQGAAVVNSLFDAACAWISFGVPVVPLQPGSKHLVAGYGAHSKIITEEEEAAYWWRDRRCNLGLVCGVPLAVLDFDAVPAYEAWRASFPGLAQTLTVITRRGRHAYFLTDRLLPSARLAEGVELKADGAVVTAVPSIHPSGHVYTWLDDNAPLLELPLTSPFLSAISERAPVVAVNQAIEGDDVVARIKRAWPILDLARSVTDLKTRDGRWWRGRCPFHKPDRRASFWIDSERGVFGCRSCSARGDVINLYAFHQGVNVQTAIRDMARRLPVGGVP